MVIKTFLFAFHAMYVVNLEMNGEFMIVFHTIYRYARCLCCLLRLNTLWRVLVRSAIKAVRCAHFQDNSHVQKVAAVASPFNILTDCQKPKFFPHFIHIACRTWFGWFHFTHKFQKFLAVAAVAC